MTSPSRPSTRAARPDVTIGWHTGDRRVLRPLFELAEDSAAELDGYLHRGRVLTARAGGEPIGHLQLLDTDRAGHTELKNMAVRQDHQGLGIGRRLVQAARALLTAEGATTLAVATAAADVGNLRFYQRQGFRMRRIERDAFTAATGYPPHADIDGIPLRDRVWLDLPLDPAITIATEEHPVNARRTPLFCSTELAARIERVETQLIAATAGAGRHRHPDGTGFTIPIAGGAAIFAEAGSPLNKVAGLGFGGVPGADALDEVERAYAARGAPTQVELAHLVDPEIAAALSDRGYRLESFENVLGRPIDGAPQPDPPPGIEVRPSGDDEFEQWLAVVADAVAHPDTQGVPWREEFPREVYERAERDFAATGAVQRHIALHEGVAAGGAGLRIAEGIAQFAGAATAPAHRRRGIQSALLAARLADAATAGCDVAVITVQPGSKSQHNAQRQGFELLYTRAVMVKPAPRC